MNEILQSLPDQALNVVFRSLNVMLKSLCLLGCNVHVKATRS